MKTKTIMAKALSNGSRTVLLAKVPKQDNYILGFRRKGLKNAEEFIKKVFTVKATKSTSAISIVLSREALYSIIRLVTSQLENELGSKDNNNPAWKVEMKDGNIIAKRSKTYVKKKN